MTKMQKKQKKQNINKLKNKEAQILFQSIVPLSESGL